MGSNQLNALREAFERMTDVDTAAAALSEAQSYRLKSGSFTSPLAQKMACDGTTSPGSYIFARKSIRSLVILVVSSLVFMVSSFIIQLHGGKCLVTQHHHFRSLPSDLSHNVFHQVVASGTGAHSHSFILKSATG
jgi:hypothetical protein